jgi:ATP/maltotriose-dependent transcriptional regulator MalT
MRNIYSKLQVNDKASAIKKAYSQKILISLI